MVHVGREQCAHAYISAVVVVGGRHFTRIQLCRNIRIDVMDGLVGESVSGAVPCVAGWAGAVARRVERTGGGKAYSRSETRGFPASGNDKPVDSALYTRYNSLSTVRQ